MAGRPGPATNTGMFLRMLFGAVFRRRSRAAMAVIASLVGAATFSCLAAVCVAVPQQMNEELRSYGANLIVTPAGGTTGVKAGIKESMVRHTTEMVVSRAPAKYAAYRYETVRINAAPYLLAGITAAQVRNLNRHWSVDGRWPSKGAVMVGTDVAEALGAEVGGEITIAYRSSDNDGSGSSSSPRAASGSAGAGASPSTPTASPSAQGASRSSGASASGADAGSGASSDILDTGGTDFRVAGIVDTGGSEDDIVYMTNEDVNSLTGTVRGADVLEYSSNAIGPELTAIAASINRMSSMGVEAQPVTKISTADTRIIAMLKSLFWLVSTVVLVLTLVGVSTTMTSIVSERRNEIALRKALGASSGGIGAEFYAESALHGLVGGVLGAVVGYFLARVLCAAVFHRALPFDGWIAGATAVLAVAIAVVASIQPVRRTARIDPAVVLSEE